MRQGEILGLHWRDVDLLSKRLSVTVALRHTAATLLLEQGEHPKVVQEMLGHSQIGLTLDTYSHVTPSMHRKAADTFDRLLG